MLGNRKGELKTPWGMGKRFGKYQKIVEVTRKYHTHALRTALVGALIFLIAGSQIFLGPIATKGATYVFTQSSWNGGLDTGGTISTSSLSGYTKFATTTQLVVGSNLSLSTTTATTTQTDDTNSNTGFNLTGVVFSNATTTGSGSSASIALTTATPPPVIPMGSATRALNCSLAATGKVYCWGNDAWGALGNGTTTNSLTPVQVLAGAAAVSDTDGTYLINIKKIATGPGGGNAVACAVSNVGNVYCWGYNGSNNFGDNGVNASSSIPVRTLKGGAVSGDNDGTYLTNIKDISIGADSACAVSNAGNIYCWGQDGYGQLGDNAVTPRATPVRVLKGGAVSGDNDGTYLTNISSVNVGYYSTCAVSTGSGNLYCWGNNTYGNLGTGNTTLSKIPVKVSAGNAPAANSYLDTGSYYLSGISSVSLGGNGINGSYYTCALSAISTYQVFCWGGNLFGQLGNATTTQSNVPVRVVKGSSIAADNDGTYLKNIRSMDAGTDHTCAASYGGNVYCWGSGSGGELGTGSTGSSNTPVRVVKGGAAAGDNDGTYLTNIVSVYGGRLNPSSTYGYGCAISGNNNIYCWGDNSYGVLGDNTQTSRSSPVQVRGINNVGTLNLATVIIYNTPGTYTSGIIDVGAPVSGWGNLSWAQTNGQTITLKARSSNTSDFSNATAWSSCSNISSGSSLASGGCVTSRHQYIQYQATLSTADTSISPSLDSVTLTYNLYTGTGSLTSSAYDTNDATTLMSGISWTEDVTRQGFTTTTISLRTASTTTILSSATWTDLTASSTNCSKAGGVVSCTSAALPPAMTSSGSNRYWQYKVQLDSDGKNTPTLSSVSVTYVQNAPPQFDTSFGTNGISVSQISTTTDQGKINIQYKLRDPDTDTGSPANQYKITPSFQYNTGGGWVNIPSQYLGVTDLAQKTVATSTYLQYSATWDAKSQLGGGYFPSLQVRVTANDNEAANNTATAAMTVSADYQPPAIASTSLNVAGRSFSFTPTDNSSFQYLLTNNADASSTDGANGSSGVYQNATSGVAVNVSNWTFVETDGYVKVFGKASDIFGNSTIFSIAAPGVPAHVDLKDTSNPAIGSYREFLSWAPYISTSSATFSKYEIYRSANSAADQNFSLLTTITNPATNYYTDDSLSTSTTYYYKLAVVDADGDRSGLSSYISDKPDGQGGTDFTPPVISSTTVVQTQTTWTKISWTTDEISDSIVDYSTDGSYGSHASVPSYVTDHSVTIQNLSPNTTYRFRVKSRDVFGNLGSDDGGGAYVFTTAGGPVISAVSIKETADKTATIVWNTDKLSDSMVYYATDPATLSGLSALSVSNSTTTMSHSIVVGDLVAKTKYYFYVKSTDPISGNASIEDNGGSYYTFYTTYDTVPPKITNISTPVVTPSAVSIVWQTDELSTSQVGYGDAPGAYSAESFTDYTLSIYHVVTLNGLKEKSAYHFQVKSQDAAGNIATSDDQKVDTTETNIVQVTVSGGGGAAPPPDTDTVAPKISDINLDSVNAFDAKLSFKTDEATTAFVKLGEDTTYGKNYGDPEYSTDHAVDLFGLRLGTNYHFQVSAIDRAGNKSVSDDRSFQTKYIAEATANLKTLDNAEQFQDQLDNLVSSVLPSLTPPFLGEVKIGNVTESAATISWTTNAKTYGAVAYGADADYDKTKDNPYPTEVSESQGKSDAHTITLSGLQPSTFYHFAAKSFIFPGVVGKSEDRTFTTKAAPIVPTITNITNSGFVVSWLTDLPTNSFVELRDAKTGKVSQVGTEELTKNHVVTIDKLTPASSYSVRAFGYDAQKNLVEGENGAVVLKKDLIPPQITSVSMSNAFIPNRQNQLQTIISWKTDEPANSQVFYEEGLGTADKLANVVGSKDEYVLQHTVIIPNFKPGTVYRFQVISTDQAGNMGQTPVRTVVTPSTKESVFEVIVKNFEDVFGFFGNVGK